MDKNERDTHFQGFAKLLYDELGTLDTLAIQRGGDYTSFDGAAKKLIAQRAYDLAYHVLYETGSGMERVFGIPYKLEQVSDLTEWPTPEEP